MAQTMAKNMDMVRSIIYILLCLVITSCKAQKDSLLYDTTPIDSKRFYKHRDYLNDYSYYTKDGTYVHIDGYAGVDNAKSKPINIQKE